MPIKSSDFECLAGIEALGLALTAQTALVLQYLERGWITRQAARNWKWGLLKGSGATITRPFDPSACSNRGSHGKRWEGRGPPGSRLALALAAKVTGRRTY